MTMNSKQRAQRIPTQMKAAALDRFGPPSVLKPHVVDVPTPGADEILIALETAGVGGWDASIRTGEWKAAGRPKFPLIPGVDGAGIVVAKGARVRRFRLGDRVYAYEFGNKKGGFYAEYVAVKAHDAARLPKQLDFDEAAAVATTGLTAMQGIDGTRVRRGQTILVFGATGAVGTIAVQLAKQRGARVLATASGAAAARLARSLGADAVIDARQDDVAEQLRKAAPNGIDAVFALAGGAQLERCLDFVRPRGRVVYPNGVEPEPKPRRGFRAIGIDAVAGPRDFAELGRRITRGRLRVPIAARYPLLQAARAHQRLEAGQVVGRIVLRIGAARRFDA
jgi:NADPH2:quinone reductase